MHGPWPARLVIEYRKPKQPVMRLSSYRLYSAGQRPKHRSGAMKSMQHAFKKKAEPCAIRVAAPRPRGRTLPARAVLHDM